MKAVLITWTASVALALSACALFTAQPAVTAECLDCAVKVLVDAVAGDTLEQIVADVTPCASKCGQDALPLVVNTLTTSGNPRVKDSQAAKDASMMKRLGAVK